MSDSAAPVPSRTRAGIDRRRFLQAASLSSAALMVAEAAIAGATEPLDPKGAKSGAAYGVFDPVAPGATRPEGWLGLYLRKQASQLGSHLPQISWPFDRPFWAGGEDPGDYDWWGWEQRGYWIDGAVRCAHVLENGSLLRQALEPIDYTLNRVASDGYLGPAYLRHPEERWPQHVFFRALSAHADAVNDRRIAFAMRRHYLADLQRSPNFYEKNDRGSVANIENILWTYERTGDPQLLDLAQRIWAHLQATMRPADEETWDLHPSRVLAQTRIRAHGVSYAEIAKLPTILYMHNGDAELLKFGVAAQERIFSHHMLIDGLPAAEEGFGSINSLAAHETCNISDMTWGWSYLLMATGDGIWGDRIERASFNAGFGLLKKDWTGVQYFSSPNQVIATDDSSHVPYHFGGVTKGWMAYRPNPGHEVACCGGNVHRFLPNYAIRMWMRDKTGGAVAALYGPSSLLLDVGQRRQPVRIHEETNYPFEEDINFRIEAAHPISFPFSLRIPRWCKSPRLELNGTPIPLPPVEKGFIRLERLFQPNDRLTLSLPMDKAVTFWPTPVGEGSAGLEHGPLVYALRVDETWTPTIAPGYATPSYPDWNARPASKWNYGIAVPEADLLKSIRFERSAMTVDPWIDPPVKLIVKMREQANWVLQSDSKQPARKMTPPIPNEDDLDRSGGQTRDISLLPYGATHLRVSIFPQVGDA